jgi:hypothetical protein
MCARSRTNIATSYLCEYNTVQGHFLAVEFVSIVALKVVYDCEILILEIENTLLCTTVR